MKSFKKRVLLLILLCLVAAAGLFYWATQPIIEGGEPISFTVLPGTGVSGAAREIAAAGVPIQPLMLEALIRVTRNSANVKAGSYELKPGITPLRLMGQLTRGEFAQQTLTVIEGWTFRQMRAAISQNAGLSHDTAQMSDADILKAIPADPAYGHPEGLFFPDTYLFAKGSSDMLVYRHAYKLMQTRLNQAWEQRDASAPYRNPYEALIMASIVEKETGQHVERAMVAGVFLNRIKAGMPLQTDPAVIYGLGDKYSGVLHKSDLAADTPYNTYLKNGLPPTPIALPGAAAINAALHPDTTDAFYFVARRDGTSVFSTNLNDHINAVNKYQR